MLHLVHTDHIRYPYYYYRYYCQNGFIILIIVYKFNTVVINNISEIKKMLFRNLKRQINNNCSLGAFYNLQGSQMNTRIKYSFAGKPKCFVIHPVMYPNKGPLIQQYLAEQAVGLVSALNWEVIQGPFWNKDAEKKKWPQTPNNHVYIEPVYGDQIQDGTYVNGTLGKGTVYKDGLVFDADESEDEEDLHKEWKNKILRESLGTSALTKCKKITQKFYFSKGKVERIIAHVLSTGSHSIFINSELKPGQIRNLKKVIEARLNNRKLPPGYGISLDQNQSDTELETSIQTQNEDQKSPLRTRVQKKTIRIFDRFSIILQIFAQRSSSKLAKLQIELSYLNYLKTRLVREGSTYSSNLNLFSGDLLRSNEFSLEIISAKQRRALGIMSGEGESQLEMEKRNIRSKEAKIRKQIEEESRLRNIKKEKEKKRMGSIPVIALVGYTNVGKSALMNYIMKKEEVESKDLLFQTLKTTTRHIILPSGTRAILLDTIGFITNLPLEMIDSFKATLEDISHADLVIHLRDISHPYNQLQKDSVIKILKQLKFQEQFYTKKMLQVWNKVDLLQSEQLLNYENDQTMKISCSNGQNITTLLETIDEKLKEARGLQNYTIQYSYDKHYDVLQYLKKVSNISQQSIEAQHNYEGNEDFPNGSVKISLDIEEVGYWKLMKYLQKMDGGKKQVLSEKDKKVILEKRDRKQRKGMPPKQGW